MKYPDDQKWWNRRFYADEGFIVVGHWNFTQWSSVEEIISKQTPGGLATVQKSSSSFVLQLVTCPNTAWWGISWTWQNTASPSSSPLPPKFFALLDQESQWVSKAAHVESGTCASVIGSLPCDSSDAVTYNSSNQQWVMGHWSLPGMDPRVLGQK